MAITEAGRRLLRQMGQRELLEELSQRDPTSSQGLVPWDGRSPRGLTRGVKSSRLGHEGASLNEVDEEIDEMCRRHQYGW